MTRAYLPLRSSVEWFENPESPEPVTRAKQAAVLYDEVVFEDGLLDASLTTQGSFVHYLHPGSFTEEDIRRVRRAPGAGEGFEIKIGIQPLANEPAPPESMISFIRGQYTAKYTAEWRTGVIDALKEFRPSWAAMLEMPDERLSEVGLGQVVAQLAQELEADAVAASDPIQRSFIVQSFSRDVAVAASMDATLQVTAMFEPLLAAEAKSLSVAADPSGRTALGIVVPNVASLPWEAIVEFRDHAGSQEARTKLREVEERVHSGDPADVDEFRRRVSIEVTDLMFSAISELRGSVGKDLAKEALNTSVSWIPFASNIASAAEMAVEAIQRRRSWHAALLKIRQATTS
jgi:hypothetical protein